MLNLSLLDVSLNALTGQLPASFSTCAPTRTFRV